MSTEVASWESVMASEDPIKAVAADTQEPSPILSTNTTHPTIPARYVDRRELAKILKVSTSTVDRMVGAGMPSETWGRRTRRFDPRAAVKWAREQGSAR